MLTARHTPCAAAGARAAAQPNAQACAARPQPRRPVGAASAQGAAASAFMGGAGGASGVAAASGRRRGSSSSRGNLQVVNVIPMIQGDASQQLPPDLPSYLFKERIVYMGMSLVPAVTELILAELLYLQFEDQKKPIYMYINSTGTTKDGKKMGYDTEAFAIYDTMQYVKPPIHTICVGTAWGEAAMLLASGAKGHRAALPSSSIMIKQPISLFRGQATDLEIQRQEIRQTKQQLVEILAKGCGKSEEEMERDISRPKYFTPYQAVEYGLIDKVLEADGARLAKEVMKKAMK